MEKTNISLLIEKANEEFYLAFCSDEVSDQFYLHRNERRLKK